MHNFTAVIGHSHSPLTKENVKSFCFTENQYKKNANLIASCILHLLKTADLTKYTRVRLMTDGCGGQNKNTIFVTMVMYWLANFAPKNIQDVAVIFPVTGHSFIPSDRVFGKIETEIKKHEMILNPADLLSIIGQFGEVINVSESVTVYNFKDSMTGVVRQTQSWPFQISKIKRILFRKHGKSCNIEIKGEQHYYYDVANFSSVFVRKKSVADILPTQVMETNCVKREKKNDVLSLLKKHFGDEWSNDERLRFFKYVIDGEAVAGENEEDDPDAPDCDPPFESFELIV